MHQGQAVENANNAVGVDGPVDFDRQGLAGELVNHVEHLQRSAVGGGVELEVHRPDHVRPDRAHRPDRRTDTGQALLPAALRNPQALLAPQAADALVVDLPTSTPCRDRGAAPSPTGPLGAEHAQPDPQLGLLIADRRWLQTHGATVHADHRTRPPLGDPEPLTQRLDGAALAVRSQNFPAEISLSMSMSRAWLATSFLSRTFSASSSLRRLPSLAFIPPFRGASLRRI
jgi:hypothetical protein